MPTDLVFVEMLDSNNMPSTCLKHCTCMSTDQVFRAMFSSRMKSRTYLKHYLSSSAGFYFFYLNGSNNMSEHTTTVVFEAQHVKRPRHSVCSKVRL